METTASRLRRLRDWKAMSQEDVARALGITRTAYVKYETGLTTPSRKLKELSHLFDVSVDYILCTEKDEQDISLKHLSPALRTQVKKYLYLSQKSRSVVDIIIDTVYEKEQTESVSNLEEEME